MMSSAVTGGDPNPLVSLFRSCVVRVDDEDGFRGTGFFVAPERVVTCGHVVHSAPGLRVRWQGAVIPVAGVVAVPPVAEVADRAGYPLPDVAVLELGAGSEGHPCVLLGDRQPALGGPGLYLAGFTAEHGPDPELTGATAEFETLVTEGPVSFFKLKRGQVRHGYSGAPLLDLESGSVAAVCESTRDAGRDLGGFAVPTPVVAEALPMVAAANREFHGRDGRWREAAEQERVLEADRRGERGRLGLRDPVVPLPPDVKASAAVLLRPRHAVVGFTGREQLLDDVATWCEREQPGGEPLGLWLVTGGGGYGKTRLAVQACLDAQARGWTAGLLPVEAGEAKLAALAEWPGRLLIAIDYAETRPDLIRHLVEEVTARTPRPPVRVLLLVRRRAARDQMLDLLNDQQEEHLGVLLARAPVSRLDESASEVDRAGLFRRASADFAALAGAVPGEVRVPQLRAGHFARPLYVLTAAYLEQTGAGADVEDLGEAGLLRALLDGHEADYWERWDQRLGLHLDSAGRRVAVALATLLTPADDTEAAAACALIPHVRPDPERLIAIARWLARLYPLPRDAGQQAIGALEPDRLGEVLAGDVLREHPGLLAAATEVTSERQLSRMLTVVGRIASEDQVIRDQLRAILNDHLADFFQRAFTTTSSDELLAAVVTAMRISRPAQGALATADRFPREVPAWMRGLVAEVAQLAADGLRVRALTDPGTLPDLAGSLNNLGVRLGEAGRREEALAPTTEAVTIRRQLAQDSPATYLPDLAMSLNNLGVRLSGAGRREEALAATAEAVTIRRQLAQDSPATYLPDLAMSLNNLGADLGEAGRREEALAPTTEAVTIRRQLAQDSPATYLPDLAMSLNNLGVRLGEAGRREEALAATAEAVTIRRQLAQDSPATYLPDLAMSLNNLGADLGEAGRREEALAPTTEAVTIRRQLAQDSPATYLPDLAMSLNNLGVRLGEAGRREEALAATAEAVTTYRRLAQDSPAYLPDLAGSLNNLGVRLGEAGRREEALAPTTEAVTIRRQLAQDSPAYLPDLAGSLNNLGVRLGEAGRREEALAPTTEAVTIRRQLAQDSPATYLPDLAGSLNNLGVRLGEAGRREEALAPTTEAVTIRRQLAQDSPATYLPDLAMSLNNLGVRLSGAGRREEALAATAEAVTIRRQLAQDSPATYLPDLAMSLNNLGADLGEAGRREEALAPTTEAVTIRRQLAQDSPATYLPDLAMSLNNLGVRLGEAGRREEALAATTEAVTTYRQLAQDSPATYLPDLAMSLNNLGVRLSEAGQREEAGQLFAEFLQAWADVPLGAGHILLARARWLDRDDRTADTASDLISAAAAFAEAADLFHRGQARRELRSLREREPDIVDQAWDRAAGPMPTWLRYPATADAEAVITWIATPDWTASQAYLKDHSAALLTDQAEADLEHLIDDNPGRTELQEHLWLLKQARTQGIDIAYAAYIAGLQTSRLTRVLQAWIETPSWDSSRQFAVTRQDELLQHQTAEILDVSGALQPGDRVLRLHRGLLACARSTGIDDAYQLLSDASKHQAIFDSADPVGRADFRLALARMRSGQSSDDPEGHFQLALAAMQTGQADEAWTALVNCAANSAPYEQRDFARRLTLATASRRT